MSRQNQPLPYLVVAVTFSCLALLASPTGASSSLSFKKIEDYLVKSSAGDSAEENLAKAKEWFHKGGHSFELSEALRHLVALDDTLKGPNRCSWNSYSILFENDHSTGALIQKGKIPVRRVEKIVHQYAAKHSQACEDVYPALFAARWPKLQRNQLRRLEIFIDKLIKASINLPPSNSKFQLHLDHDFCKKIILSSKKRAHSALLQLVEEEDDPDAKFLEPSQPFLPNKVEQLFVKYLLQPCQYYNSQLAADVFIPAQFDAILHFDVRPTLVHYYEGWARFRFCQVLQSDHSQLLQDVLNIVRDEGEHARNLD